jgi:hypothetical protein
VASWAHAGPLRTGTVWRTVEKLHSSAALCLDAPSSHCTHNYQAIQNAPDLIWSFYLASRPFAIIFLSTLASSLIVSRISSRYPVCRHGLLVSRFAFFVVASKCKVVGSFTRRGPEALLTAGTVARTICNPAETRSEDPAVTIQSKVADCTAQNRGFPGRYIIIARPERKARSGLVLQTIGPNSLRHAIRNPAARTSSPSLFGPRRQPLRGSGASSLTHTAPQTPKSGESGTVRFPLALVGRVSHRRRQLRCGMALP